MIDPAKLSTAAEQRRLSRIHDITRNVLDLQPTHAAVLQLQTNHQDTYGYDLTEVWVRDENGQTLEVAETLVDKLIDDLHGDLSSLSWRGEVGSDPMGGATIEVPGAVSGPVGTWIRLDVDELRAWLSRPVKVDGEKVTYAYEDLGIGSAWGTAGDLDGSYGNQLTDIIADLPDSVLSSVIGASPAVDGLWDDDYANPHARVYVTLDFETRFGDSAVNLCYLVDTADHDGDHPEVERLVGSIVNVIKICNGVIDAVDARFPIG